MKKKNKANQFLYNYLNDFSNLIKPDTEIINKLIKVKDVLLSV